MVRNVLLVMLLAGCARYQTHDPSSYCKSRHLAPRVRPSVVCRNGFDAQDCKEAVTIELYWKCDEWSSW